MINVSMASWLQDVHGFISRVRRRNRLVAIATDDRQNIILDTVLFLLRIILNLIYSGEVIEEDIKPQFLSSYDTYIKYLRNLL